MLDSHNHNCQIWFKLLTAVQAVKLSLITFLHLLVIRSSICNKWFFFTILHRKIMFSPQSFIRSLYLPWFNRGGPTKYDNFFSQIVNLTISMIFDKNSEFTKKTQGTSLKARGLIFWNLTDFCFFMNIHIYIFISSREQDNYFEL